MNKKGAEKVMSVYWFAIIIIVAGAIFGMVYIFYHHPYDVREIEANLLVNKATDCLSSGGKLHQGIFDDGFSENFLESCDITFEAEEKWEDPQYYLGIKVSSAELGNLVVDIVEGNKNLITSCGAEKEVEKEKIAKCVERDFYSLDEVDDLYMVKILSIVRKTEKNVRQ